MSQDLLPGVTGVLALADGTILQGVGCGAVGDVQHEWTPGLRHEWLASATLDSGIDALMHETQQALAQYNARREKERGRKSTGLRALDIGQLQRHQLPPAVASGGAAPPSCHSPCRPATVRGEMPLVLLWFVVVAVAVT